MKTKILATYLPQFHRIEENSKWWGAGFTEWTNVARARPLFPGHYQPHIPADLGFYDLSTLGPLREQAELARDYGIDGFNYYFYWFSGKRILEKPLESFLESDIDIEFSLCWANENWTRKWDGGNKEILLEQGYEKGFEEGLFADLLPYLRDSRYVRIDGKPILSIYKVQELPNPSESLQRLRMLAAEQGLGGLHIIAVETFGLQTPEDVGADAMMEFPPSGTPPEARLPAPEGSPPDFTGQFWDYSTLVRHAAEKKDKEFIYYRGVMPSWDNSPRVGSAANVFLNSSPELFRLWLEFSLSWSSAKAANRAQPLVFVNAWNEWAEGAHLEPDLRNGRHWLEAVRQAKQTILTPVEEIRKRIAKGTDALGYNYMGEGLLAIKDRSLLGILQALSKEVNFNNLKHVIRIWGEDKTGRKLLTSLRSALKGVVRVRHRAWKPRGYLRESNVLESSWQSNVLITCHIYHEEYIQRLAKLTQTYSDQMQFLVTTSKAEIKRDLDALGLVNLRVILTINRGRNFGPLLVDAASEMKKFKYVVHLHSKKSTHSSLAFSQAWADALWSALAENPKILQRFVSLFELTPDLSIGYPLITNLIHPRHFGWAGNYDQARSWHIENDIEMPNDPIPFPAGGMFFMRTSDFQVILEHGWSFEDFPPESGELDGTTQHLIERLLGTLPISLGRRHAVYIAEKDRFTDDVSYVLG
jgi:lipopolysaccharide biosynthesis protein